MHMHPKYKAKANYNYILINKTAQKLSLLRRTLFPKNIKQSRKQQIINTV